MDDAGEFPVPGLGSSTSPDSDPDADRDPNPDARGPSRIELVPGAHRVIRLLYGTESPYPGALVRDGDGQRVCVDAAAAETGLWDFASAEHVVGVRDVLRTADGHGALLPWCIEPVAVFLARREAAGRPLSSGEVTTLVGSLLRGTTEVGATPLRGRWWLDDRARPLFAPGEGVTCGEAAAGLVERIGATCSDRALQRVLTRIRDGLADHRVVQRALDGWERELMDLAAPRALEQRVYAPERVQEIPLHRARGPQDPRAGERGSPREHRMGERLARAAEGVRRAVSALRERMLGRGRPVVGSFYATERPTAADAPRTPRRRMLLVAGAAAAAVLLGGLLWPAGGGQSSPSPAAVAETTRLHAPAEGGADPEGRGSARTPSPTASIPTDLAQTARALLKEAARCTHEGDPQCARAVVAGSAPTVLERVGPDADGRDAAVIEDYGDVAVIRLAETSARSEQMLVLERAEDGWLVRDVYDVADQPSEGG
ncbi:hypothetical protein [Microbacterium soli]|uniref:Serine/threonine protein kinase n=1 Tax=Microbacterium soli TaxID=446075 RepID=A0ABP7NHT4_9MICO